MNLNRRQFTTMAAAAAAAQAISSLGFIGRAEAAENEELTELSLAQAAARVRAGGVSAVELTQASLARIAMLDPKLDAFITVAREQALAQARQLDAEQKAGKLRGPLHGVPIAIKDNIDTAAIRTTGASAVFEDRVPKEDAPVVARLKAAGAVIVGKTNLQEFAMGGGETSFFGPARNPWALDHNTGGSSSGSGAAISARLAYGALGTDTAGSVRMPASYCGVVGLKPTYGLVPIRGIIPLILSLDHCGPLTRTVEDTALMLGVMAGYDKLDITSVDHPHEDYLAALKQPVSDLRLGLPAGYFDHVDPEVSKATETAIALLGKLTAGVRDVSLPGITDMGNLGALGEVYAWHEEYFQNAAAKYMLPERMRLQTLFSGNAKATDYIRARWKLELLRRTIDDAFTDFDLVVMPTQRILPPPLDELIKRAHDSKPMDPLVTSNCGPFDIYGLPAVSIPCGFSKSGLPIGLMIAGPRFSEGRVLALAQAYQQATDWHRRKPPVNASSEVPPVVSG